MLKNSRDKLENWHINQSIERANQESFWHYFTSQALQLSLTLICDDISITSVGLVLPLQATETSLSVYRSENLSKVGEPLIGWLARNHSLYMFFDLAPSFEYPSDYRVHPSNAKNETEPKDSKLIVVEIIRRLLVPLYEDVRIWRPYLD